MSLTSRLQRLNVGSWAASFPAKRATHPVRLLSGNQGAAPPTAEQQAHQMSASLKNHVANATGSTTGGPRGVRAQIMESPERKQRYYQVLWNIGTSFVVMLLAAQALKSAQQRRKLAAQVETLQQDIQTSRAVLKSLLQEHEYAALVDKIARLDKPTTMMFWKGNNEDWKQRVRVMIFQDMEGRIGEAALDEVERDRAALQSLQTPEIVADGHTSDTTTSSNKRRVFSI